METFNRYRLMLQMLPRLPGKISVRDILRKLEDAGCNHASERNIQRDLDKLSAIFPIVNDNRKPRGWSWAKDGLIIDIPGMDPQIALTFRLVEIFMQRLIPHACLAHIKPYFDTANKTLESIKSEKLVSWPEKLVVLTRNQPLIAPVIKDDILFVVYQALFTEKRFTASYRPREREPAAYEINPLGLVFVDSLLYLVCTLWEYDHPIQLALHRMVSADISNKPSRVPERFSLAEYISRHEFEYPLENGAFHLEILLERSSAFHLQETPLAEDQTVSPHIDGRMLLTATVCDTERLRWWLLGFGSNVEVLRPEWLRDEFRRITSDMRARYR